jgi:predicted MFS family arabinose efflux permease
VNGSFAPRGQAVRIFLAFAFAYFFSALLRAVTATLAPAFSAEMGLRAADLGLLAGAYFFGFAALQLPLGSALDRLGPKRVLLGLLVLALAGCAAFALARGLASLVFGRVLIGMGVSACLMAPLTCYRARFGPALQLRANSWMLMTGSLGMLASTLPVQWLLPLWGWRGLFWAVAALLMLAMALIHAWVPEDPVPGPPAGEAVGGYQSIVTQPVFVRSAPIGFVIYGGLVAVQSLWAGPWLTRVAGWSAAQAAGGLFTINLGMLFAFMAWGAVMPRLSALGVQPHRLMAWGLPISLVLMAVIVLRPEPAGAGLWTLWCVSCTFVSLSQPAVGQAFAAQQAGRALSAFNLVIFGGVFCIQWGIGLAIDLLRAAGWPEADAFRAAFAGFGAACALSYIWFVWPPRRWRE